MKASIVAVHFIPTNLWGGGGVGEDLEKAIVIVVGEGEGE
jgi:hypothetical protein